MFYFIIFRFGAQYIAEKNISPEGFDLISDYFRILHYKTKFLIAPMNKSGEETILSLPERHQPDPGTVAAERLHIRRAAGRVVQGFGGHDPQRPLFPRTTEETLPHARQCDPYQPLYQRPPRQRKGEDKTWPRSGPSAPGAA